MTNNYDPTLPDDIQENINRFLPFLVELRKRILFIFSVFFIFSTLGFFYYEKIIIFILKLLDLQKINIVFTSPFQFVNLSISSAFTIGIISIFPLFIFQILSFLKPALKQKEYRLLTILLPVGMLLFVGGFYFGAMMMKYLLALFFKKSIELNISNMIDISTLLSSIINTSTLMGLAFQFPVVLTLLLRLNVVKHRFLSQQRPFVYCAVIIFAALLPPTDILSLLLLTFPLVFLFEITLLLNRLFKKPQIARKEVENV